MVLYPLGSGAALTSSEEHPAVSPALLPRHLRPWIALALCLGLVAGLIGWFQYGRHREFPLYSSTIAVTASGNVTEVGPDDRLVAGTRVLAGPGADQRVKEQRAWLAAGTVPAIGELGDSTMVRDALLDLHLLGSDHGVAVAGWGGPWHYVWPRDSALIAAALARTGHPAEATRLIRFLQQTQPVGGVFEARYRPDGSGPPDDRGQQIDGLGWVLWGSRQVADALPAAQQARFLQEIRPLIERSTGTILSLTDTRSGLPPASPDYWELKEDKRTLATSALLLAGLESATSLYTQLDEPNHEASAAAGAARLRQAITDHFGPDGYPRLEGGRATSVDLGASFLLPPFTAEAEPDVVAAWHRSAEKMKRPAGGLAPGGSWVDDGVSWTPTTSTYALVAAGIDRTEAVRWLRWLDQHRTAHGSLPEKVLDDGSAASVAPIGWTAAAVILTVDALSR